MMAMPSMRCDAILHDAHRGEARLMRRLTIMAMLGAVVSGGLAIVALGQKGVSNSPACGLPAPSVSSDVEPPRKSGERAPLRYLDATPDNELLQATYRVAESEDDGPVFHLIKPAPSSDAPRSL